MSCLKSFHIGISKMRLVAEFTNTRKLMNSHEYLKVGQAHSAQGYSNADAKASILTDVYS